MTTKQVSYSLLVLLAFISNACSSPAVVAPAPTVAPATEAPAPTVAAAAEAPAPTIAPTDAPEGGGSVSWTRFAEANPVFHPVEAQSNQYSFFYLLFGQLVRLDLSDASLQTITPDLAEAWEISADATVFTFKLRKDVKWQDGRPFTADDVVYTATWGAENKNAYIGFSPAWFVLKGQADVQASCDADVSVAAKCGGASKFDGVKKLDDYTVQFTLDKPNVTFLRSLADAPSSIMPLHLLAGQTADQINKGNFKNKSPIGTGPFTLGQIVPDQYMEFIANPAYFKGAPKLEKVIYKQVTPETALAQIETGELDIILNAGASNYERLSKIDILDTRVLPAPGIFTIVPHVESQSDRTRLNKELSLDLPPLNFDFSDKRVRQAMYYAIDRRTINDELFGGRNKILWNPPGFKADYPGLNQYEYSPAKAKELLAAAEKDKTVDLDKKMVFYYANELGDGAKLAPIIKQQLEDVGFKVELNGVAIDAWEKVVTDDSQRGTYDVGFSAGGAEGLGPNRSQIYFKCGAEPLQNQSGYYNCDLRKLFEKALTQANPVEQDKTYAEIAKLLNDEAPQLYLWQLAGVHPVNKRVQNATVPAFERYATMSAYEWSVNR